MKCDTLGILGWMFVAAALLLAPVQAAEPTKPVATKEPSGKEGELTLQQITEKQRKIALDYDRLEQLLGKMATFEGQTNPKRAALLKQALLQSKERLTLTQLRTIESLLAKSQLDKAIDGQNTAETDLKSLLELLQSENRADRLKSEQARIREYIKEVERLLRLERGIQGQTEGGADAKQLAEDQAKVAERTGELAKRIQENEEGGAKNSSGENKNADGSQNKSESENKSGDKDSKPSDNKDGMGPMGEKPNADSKSGDSKPSDKPNDGKPSDGKPSAGKPSDGKSSDGKPNDGKSPPKKDGDAKPSDGKQPDDKKSGDKDDKKSSDGSKPDSKPDASKDSKPGDQKSGDQKSGDQKSGDQKSGSQSKSQPGQPQQGQSKPGGDSGDSKQSPQQQQQAQNPARQRIQAAEERMREAEKKLAEAKRKEALEEQEKAKEELEKAKAALEEILRQMREEEMERTLAMLEGRFKKMLEMQLDVYEKTKLREKELSTQPKEEVAIRCGQLAGMERKIVYEADKVLNLLREEGSSIAFPETVDQMRQDMDQVASRLDNALVGTLTQNIEEEIIATLEELIDAIQKAQQDLEKKKQQQQQGQQQGQQQDQPLVDQIAELKMIKSLQLRVNSRTRRFSQLLDDSDDPVGQVPQNEKDLREALGKLAEREAIIQRITRDIVLGKNK